MKDRFADPRWKYFIAACLLAYFLYSAWFGLRAHLAADDYMNLALYYRQSPAKIAVSQFAVWENFYRPMGALFYLPIYSVFGLHPRPFRIIALIFLLCNVYLCYRLAKLLGATELAAVLATFVVSYHRAMGLLYFNTAFIYDVMCYFFYLSALVVYLRVRARDRLPGWQATLAVLALYLCALNSKENAPTFPMILLVYEWLYHRPASWKPSALLSWMFREGRVAMIAVPLTAAYVYGKTVGPQALAMSDAYRPVFTWERILQFQRGAMIDMLYSHWVIQNRDVAIIWLLLTAIALLSKRRLLRFSWWWILLTALPITFVNRFGPSMYIPMLGWVLFVAASCAALIDRISNWFAPRLQTAVTIGLALLAIVPVAIEGRAETRDRYKPSMAEEGKPAADVIAELDAVNPRFRPGGRVLFLNDPFDDWDMVFITTLWAHDRTLEVRLHRKLPVPPEDHAQYDSILRFDNGKLVQLK